MGVSKLLGLMFRFIFGGKSTFLNVLFLKEDGVYGGVDSISDIDTEETD